MAEILENERIYVLVPKTVQVESDSVSEFTGMPTKVAKSYPMVAGRLIAQGVHVGRLLGDWFAKHDIPYRDITTITLSVRNTKELRKVSNEIAKIVSETPFPYKVGYEEFYDSNPGFYQTQDKVHTITAVGPLTREALEDAIGHLELYD